MGNNTFQIGAFCRTIRYLKPHQIVARLSYKLKKVYYLSPLYFTELSAGDLPAKLAVNPPQLWLGKPKYGEEICCNVFTFAGRTINMGKEVNWYPREASPLWIYHLHYFDWLKDLKSLGREGLIPAREFIDDWLLTQDTFQPISWHPYPLSLRIISWVTHADWLLTGCDEEFRTHFMSNLTQQIKHLDKVLEWDVGGNHLIKNLKAVIYGGLCLPGRQSHFLEAMNLLLEQLKIQALPDGAHYERSPHYHADVLQDLLDIQALMKKSGHQNIPVFDDTIDRMATVLKFYCHGDGQLSLFNDGEVGDGKHIKSLIERCHPEDILPTELSDAGYVRLSGGDSLLLMDTGLCCPDELPAHAHADTLSFEYSLGDERIFVNSGTYAYQHTLRNIFRGTAAHNTVVVNHQDSAEVYKVFRLGRRPRQILTTVTKDNTGVQVSAQHDGYRAMNIVHHRSIFMSTDGSEVRGEDTVSGKKPQTVAAHFHLNPHLTYHIREAGKAIIQTPSGRELCFEVTGGRLYDAESQYAPHFGEIITGRQLVLRADRKLWPAQLKWTIKTL